MPEYFHSERKTHPDFNQDLRFGQQAEREIATMLVRGGVNARCEQAGSSHDIMVDTSGACIRVEVKREDRYAESGNICIETHQGWPPRQSGILASRADYYLHLLGEWTLIYEREPMVEVIRSRIASGIWPQIADIKGSDNHNRGLVLSTLGLRSNSWQWMQYIRRKDLADAVAFRGRMKPVPTIEPCRPKNLWDFA